ncbi:putative short-chain dehydrogenase reductase sdr protein [Neofusicoccum parvum UCRNP2]|uniref:Putative short-chain dehydrogenase reductase sdr protein n=1 Tax=Botryosphaeria parva (strain UCR-NP2) TaxID=1287680 RepID=R1E6N0_BOTPV|nr:putative short-chain dehydrogenase reductase sdr protein [Neofusicoccum parvum UCRNP2]
MSHRTWETDYTSTFHHSSYAAISPSRPELSAAGKTIFISGGARGLGTGIVDGFAQAGAARLVVMGRTATTLQAIATRIEAAHPSTSVAVVVGDVSREADVARAFADAKKLAPGGIDVLVANAGYFPTTTAVPPASDDSEESADVADWWRAWEVNVKGVYLLARHFLAPDAAAPGAAFVNISAGACHINPPFLGFSAYAGSKIGMARVVETMQAENPGLRFFNVQPGVVKTDMLIKSGAESYNMPLDEPELPGHFLVWLTSPEGEFLKGKFVWVNWDVDELKAKKEEILAGHKLVTGLVGWA